jgi:hypothetical protein
MMINAMLRPFVLFIVLALWALIRVRPKLWLIEG